uniref:Trafficking protein particle complex subunit 10 n=1 Tax=Cacopsylla melanoneura TaxID=428564 RepID=A0A8D9EI66_9HEMI
MLEHSQQTVIILVIISPSDNNNSSQPRWKLSLERSFSIEAIDVNILSKQLSCELVLNIHSNFPMPIEAEEILISIDTVSQSKKDSLHSKRYCVEKYRKNSRPFPQKLPMLEEMDYQEDKTLASVNIVCDSDKYWLDSIRRQDSQQKLNKTTIPSRGNFTKKFSCTNITLKPGDNTIVLKSNMYKSGIYRISQLCIESHKRLEFLSNPLQPKVLFEIKESMASVTVTPLSDLVAGIHIPIEIKIDTGSSTLPAGSKLVLSSSPGLSYLPESQDTSLHHPLETQITLPLKEDQLGAFTTSNLRLIMIAELPHQKDNAKIDHSMWIKCPWSEEQNHVKFAFEMPFACSCKLQTVSLRKFLQVTVQGFTKFNISLTSASLTCSETLKPVTVFFPISVCENKTATLVWELLLSQSEDIKSNLEPLNSIQQQYSVEDNKENEHHLPLLKDSVYSPSKQKKRTDHEMSTAEEQCFSLDFTLNYSYGNYSSRFACLYNISNYKTLYIVETRIESLKGASDFCRVSTMCHLIIEISKVFSSPVEYCLTYEVVADQTLWAVCGSNADHIAMDEVSKKASISLDVMPLINGHLPIPLVKISKYFPPSKGFRGHRNQARSEVFSPGEVYNKSKASQVHVIVPSANNEL